MDLSTLGNHLRGKSPLTVTELRGIAEVLDMTPQEILDRADHILGREQRRIDYERLGAWPRRRGPTTCTWGMWRTQAGGVRVGK